MENKIMQHEFTRGGLRQTNLIASCDKKTGFLGKGNVPYLIHLHLSEVFDGKLFVTLKKIGMNN